MTRFIRFFIVIIKSFFLPKIRSSAELINDCIDLNFRIWPHEADGALLNNASYFPLLVPRPISFD